MKPSLMDYSNIDQMTGLIHHIELYVSDLKKSTDFWSKLLEKLNYTVYQKWSSGISFIKANTYIVLVQTQSKYIDIPYHRCATGLNHIAFWVEDKVLIDQIKNYLEKKNVTILYGDKYPENCSDNYYALYFEDPDRIKVELVYQRSKENSIQKKIKTELTDIIPPKP